MDLKFKNQVKRRGGEGQPLRCVRIRSKELTYKSPLAQLLDLTCVCMVDRYCVWRWTRLLLMRPSTKLSHPRSSCIVAKSIYSCSASIISAIWSTPRPRRYSSMRCWRMGSVSLPPHKSEPYMYMKAVSMVPSSQLFQYQNQSQPVPVPVHEYSISNITLTLTWTWTLHNTVSMESNNGQVFELPVFFDIVAKDNNTVHGDT